MAGGVCVRASRGHLLSDRFAREVVSESLDRARQDDGECDCSVHFRGHDDSRDTTMQPLSPIVPNMGKTGRFAYCKGAFSRREGPVTPAQAGRC